MGLASVDKDGTFSITGDLRSLYIVMMIIRMIIVKDCNTAIFAGSSIALRYNCVRRQFKTYNGSKDERKIIDYQTQQHVLTPILAQAYLMNVVGRKVKNDFGLMMTEISIKNYERMDIMHHLLAGFKSIFSD